MSTAVRWSVFVVLLLAFILVPFVLLEGRMNELVQHTLGSVASIAWIVAPGSSRYITPR